MSDQLRTKASACLAAFRIMKAEYGEDIDPTIADMALIAEAYLRMSEWQPISTAPKDGTDFLAAWADDEEMHVVYILEGECRREMDREPWTMPTHWMPLPSPPTPEGE